MAYKIVDVTRQLIIEHPDRTPGYLLIGGLITAAGIASTYGYYLLRRRHSQKKIRDGLEYRK